MIPNFKFSQFVESICNRPVMYVGKLDYELVVAYLNGVDHFARELPSGQTFLSGFTEWLDIESGRQSSLVWENRILTDAQVSNEAKIKRLGEVILEFRKELERKGLQRIKERHISEFQ